MAYNNVEFPYYPTKHDIVKEVIDPVSIITNGNYEYRVKKQRWEKFKWTLPTQTMKADQRDAVRAFLLARQNGLNSFKFQDPDIPSLTDALLSWNSGTLWNLNLPLDANTAGTHPIFHPGSLTVTVNGSPGTISSYNVTNGVPTITVTGTNSGSIVRVSGTIYFTVRLDSSFSQAYSALDSNNKTVGLTVNEISLVEVFEY